jgi:hypothetical protein
VRVLDELALIPLHVAQVPSMAVVWPAPSATGPSTTSVARVPSEGYPAVLISWFGAAKRMGAVMMYCADGQSERT